MEKEIRVETNIKTKRPGGIGNVIYVDKHKSTRNSCVTYYKWVCNKHLKYIYIYICDCFKNKQNSTFSDEMDTS